MDFLITTGIRILEFLFFAGWIGSFLVILLSGIEDIETVLNHNDENPRQPAPPAGDPEVSP